MMGTVPALQWANTTPVSIDHEIIQFLHHPRYFSRRRSPGDDKLRRQLRRWSSLSHRPAIIPRRRRDRWGNEVPADLPWQNIAVSPLLRESLPLSPTTRALLDNMLTNMSLDTKYTYQRKNFPSGTASAATSAYLVLHGIAEPLPASAPDALGLTTVEEVPEKLGTPKARIRLVSDTLSANIAGAPIPTSARFQPITTLFRRLARHTQPLWFLSFDLTTSFFQIELPATVRHLFVFSDPSGVLYQFTRLPMGYRFSVDILQTILESIMMTATFGLPQSVDVITDCYVDNGLIACADRHVLESIQARLRQLFTDANITVGSCDISDHVEHRGICIYPSDQRRTLHYSLKPSFRSKIQQHLRSIIANCHIRVDQLETICGELTYAESVITPSPIRNFYHTYGLWTETVRNHKRKVRLPAAVGHEFQSVLQWISGSPAMSRWKEPQPDLGTPATVTFTDASQFALGVLYIRNHRDAHFGQCANPLDMRVHTSAAELLALVHVLNTNPYNDSDVNIFCSDNIAAVRAMNRRFSSSINMHTVLSRLQKHLIHPSFHYIRGEMNPADKPSRQRLVNLTPLSVAACAISLKSITPFG